MKDCPRLLTDFLTYLTTITGKSIRTRNEYYYDLRFFLKFQIAVQQDLDFETLKDVNIQKVDIKVLEQISLEDLYFFMEYCERVKGNSPSARARKSAAIKSFFKYLKNKRRLLDYNPAEELEAPKLKKRAPIYLTLDESQELLQIAAASSPRNYAIVTLFLNLGIRVSELCNLNISSVTDEFIRVIGKGDKERIVYLNESAKESIERYLIKRTPYKGHGLEPLFTTQKGTRITRQRIAQIIQLFRKEIRLNDKKITPHKLRHTSATLMYKAGADIRTLQEILGHTNIGTTQIYTHIDNETMKNAMKVNPLNVK